MTYGWAILAVAVVLGVLFQLGVFGGVGTPRAQPGNCQVVKVGTGLTQTISLAGECQGQQPLYVAQFNNPTSYISLPTPLSGFNGNTMSFTLSLWIDPTTAASVVMVNEQGTTPPSVNSGIPLLFTNGAGALNAFTYHCIGAGTVKANTWTNVAITYTSGGTLFYVNGVLYGTDSGARSSGLGQYLSLGAGATSTVCSAANAVVGYYANYQIYNTSLSGTEIQALYMEGIGGAPVRPQNITVWWPLNGNENDYSSNNNNGQPSGITFTSSWTSGYTAP